LPPSAASLTDDEIAVYDALAANKSARQVMGDEKLKVIATELINQVPSAKALAHRSAWW
jgi:Type I restriction enzyme HindI endonuclease subunit-like, C-terminal